MIIRKAFLKDEEDIINICYETRSKELERGTDKTLFALRWALYYLWFQTYFCFVAEEDSKVIGYILSSPDTTQQENDYKKHILPLIKSRITKDHPDYSFYTTATKDSEILGDHLKKYPAHLHINLTAECQGNGIGSKLIKVMEDNLKSHNIKGVFLGVEETNTAAINFYNKNNYRVFHSFLYDGDSAATLFMGKNLL